MPHPALAQTYARELLNVKPFPTFLGYSSRLLAESWDSNNLYWARLADEMGYSPVMLNRLVPELTHRMVEQILPHTSKIGPRCSARCGKPERSFARARLLRCRRAALFPDFRRFSGADEIFRMPGSLEVDAGGWKRVTYGENDTFCCFLDSSGLPFRLHNLDVGTGSRTEQ